MADYNKVPRNEVSLNLEDTNSSETPNAVKLCESIMVSNMAEVERLLKSNVEIRDCYCRATLRDGMTLVHVAAKKKEKKYLEKVLQTQQCLAEVDTADCLGYTPLMHAVDAGSIENVRLLINNFNVDISTESKSRYDVSNDNRNERPADRKPDCSLQNKLKRTAFHIAAGRSQKDILGELLEKARLDSIDVDLSDDNDWTPLFWAAQSGDHDCFANLLHLSDVFKVDASKRNVLHIIAENDCHGILKVFTDQSLNVEIFNELLKSKDIDQLTPFMTSVAKGNVETARILMTYEDDIEKEDSKGNSILHLAAERGRYKILQLLLRPQLLKLKTLKDKDRVFVDEAMHVGTSPSDIKQFLELVGHAMPESANQTKFGNICYADMIKKVNNDGCNCFHLAASSGDIHCLKLLYICCIKMHLGFVSFNQQCLDVKNKSGATPLHYAIRSRSKDVIKFLIIHRADLMSRTKLLPILPGKLKESMESQSDQTDGRTVQTWGRICSCLQMNSVKSVFVKHPTSVSYIMKTHNGKKILKELFDDCIMYERSGEDRKELVVDFQLLIRKSGSKMAILNELYKQNHLWLKDVLHHPLPRTFIENEWLKRKYYPWFQFWVYFIYLTVLTTHLWLPTDPRWLSRTVNILVGFLSFLILLLCVPYFLPGQTMSERVKGILIRMPPPLLAFISTLLASNNGLSLPLCSLSVTLSWLSLIFYSSALSLVHSQAAQFQTVLFTMLKNIPVFLVVVFGFSFTFYTLYFREDNFQNVGKAFIFTTIILLQGGMEHSPHFARNATGVNTELRIAESFISFLFMIVAGVALLNMLIGLAVSGAEDLRNQGRLVFMRHQIKLLLELDQILELWKPVKKIYMKVMKIKSNSVTETSSTQKNFKLRVDVDGISMETQILLHDIARARWLKSEGRNKKNENARDQAQRTARNQEGRNRN